MGLAFLAASQVSQFGAFAPLTHTFRCKLWGEYRRKTTTVLRNRLSTHPEQTSEPLTLAGSEDETSSKVLAIALVK
jgi:hypothetical protein